MNMIYGQPGVANAWFHVSTTCSEFTTPDCSMYINGCSVPVELNNDPRDYNFGGYEDFLLGDTRGVSISTAYLTMDELMIWEESLNDEQMWQVYRQYG